MSHSVKVFVSEGLRRALALAAAHEGVSMSHFMNIVLVRHIFALGEEDDTLKDYLEHMGCWWGVIECESASPDNVGREDAP